MVYFCHGCVRQVPFASHLPSGEIQCLLCSEPFVEILDEDMEVEDSNLPDNQPEQPNINAPPPIQMSFSIQINNDGSGAGFQFQGFSSNSANIQPSEPQPTFADILEGIQIREGIRPARRMGPFSMAAPGLVPPFLDISDGPVDFQAIFGAPIDVQGGPMQIGDFVMGDFDEILEHMRQQHEDPGKPPASEKAISQLRTRTLTKEDEIQLAGHQCAVCQDKFLEKEEVTCLPCNHEYHKNCVLPWLNMHCTCPVCRCEVNEKSCTEPKEAEMQNLET